MTQVFLVQLALAQGRRTRAEHALAAAERILPGSTGGFRVAFATYPFLTGRCEGAASLQTSLAGRPPAYFPRIRPLFHGAAWREWPAEYPRGLLAACRGDHSAALTLAARLEPDAGGDELAAQVRAHVAWAEGALPLEPVLADLARPGSGGFPLAHQRWLRAELLRRLGRDTEALNSYRAIPQDLDFGGIIYYAPAELRQAEILDRLGHHREAADHYARFIHLWRHADPELRPVVQRAEARLAQLRSQAGADGEGEQRSSTHAGKRSVKRWLTVAR